MINLVARSPFCKRSDSSAWSVVSKCTHTDLFRVVRQCGHCCSSVHFCHAGAREGHETYRFLSTAAALDLLAAASSSAGVVTGGRLQHGGKAKAAVPLPHASWLLEVLPEVAVAVKAGLNTLQPSLAAHMLLMLQR